MSTETTVMVRHRDAVAHLDTMRDALRNPPPKPTRTRKPRRKSWWIRLITETYRDALYVWEAQREEATAMYETEMREWEESHPRPTMKETMMGLRGAA